MKIPFSQIDAFAGQAFTGNPAAVMPLRGWLDDASLQQIAEENNLSETAFIVPSAEEGVDFDLRWFTPGAEVALCGHATLASGHFVLSSDSARAIFSRGEIGQTEEPSASAQQRHDQQKCSQQQLTKRQSGKNHYAFFHRFSTTLPAVKRLRAGMATPKRTRFCAPALTTLASKISEAVCASMSSDRHLTVTIRSYSVARIS